MQDTNILVKVLKENAFFFAEQITQFNEGICSSKYPESFKLANITPKSILPIISKIFESLCANNFQIMLMIYFQNFNVVVEKDLVHNIVFF